MYLDSHNVLYPSCINIRHAKEYNTLYFIQRTYWGILPFTDLLRCKLLKLFDSEAHLKPWRSRRKRPPRPRLSTNRKSKYSSTGCTAKERKSQAEETGPKLARRDVKRCQRKRISSKMLWIKLGRRRYFPYIHRQVGRFFMAAGKRYFLNSQLPYAHIFVPAAWLWPPPYGFPVDDNENKHLPPNWYPSQNQGRRQSLSDKGFACNDGRLKVRAQDPSMT